MTTSIETEYIIKKKKLPANKSPRRNGFRGDFYQTYTKELIPILIKLFQNIDEEETLPKSLCKATITMLAKENKENFFTTEKEIKGQYL